MGAEEQDSRGDRGAGEQAKAKRRAGRHMKELDSYTQSQNSESPGPTIRKERESTAPEVSVETQQTKVSHAWWEMEEARPLCEIRAAL